MAGIWGCYRRKTVTLTAETFCKKSNCSGPTKSEHGAVEIGALQSMGVDLPVGTGIPVAEGATVCPAAVDGSCFIEIKFLHFFFSFHMMDCVIIYGSFQRALYGLIILT